MKVLLIGDASHYHATLGCALRDKGCDVTVASEGGMWMRTPYDISVNRPFPGLLGGAALYARMLAQPRLYKGYDVVQLVNPAFVQLRPHRLLHLFRRLRQNNGAVWLTALGTDTPYIEQCLDPNSQLRYNEWMVNGQPTEHYRQHSDVAQEWLSEPLRGLCREVYDGVDGVITDLYEYHLAARRWLPGEKVHYAGIPIESGERRAESGECLGNSINRKVRLFLGRHSYRLTEKGTDMLEQAARRIVGSHPDRCALDIVEDVPYDEYLSRLDNADIVLDQAYSYTPATNALLAMAKGKAVVSGGEEEYYQFIGEGRLRPIINARPDVDSLAEAIEKAVMNPDWLTQLRREGPEFVLRHNAAPVVAQLFLDAWQH